MDTSYYIFESLFLCRYSKTLKSTIEELESTHQIMPSNYKNDNYSRANYITGYLTINDMVELLKKNSAFYVEKYEDTEKIYRYIEDHLQYFKTRIEKGVNLGDVPYEDLIALDKLANIVYDKAKYHFKPEILNSPSINILEKLRQNYNIFNPVQEKNVMDMNDEERDEHFNSEKRISLEEMLARGVRGRQVWK